MKKIKISYSASIRDAMKQLDSNQEKCLMVTNEKNKLLGTITDGDIRRAILSGANISDPINDFFSKDPIVLSEKNNNSEAKELLLKYKISLIPIIDEGKKIVSYVSWDQFNENKNVTNNSLENIHVVIMAGGYGTRMKPFTDILPKPLVPIHQKPIIEHIIDEFTELGCNDFHLTVNYKAKIMKAYFDELDTNYNINFVDESKPLGTAGSLRLLNNKIELPFFVSNCDILVKTNYSKLYDFHNSGNYDVTLVASTKEYIIPYGTCALNPDGHLEKIDEKPKYNFLINTGMYVLNPEILELIPKNKFFHITHLIQKAKDKGKKIGVYPVSEDSWIDIGQWKEYKKVVEEL